MAATVGAAAVAVTDLVAAAAEAPTLGPEPLERWAPLEVVDGARFGLVCAGLALLCCLYGLSRGRRTAWRVATAMVAVSIVSHPIKRADLGGAVVAVVGLVVLVGARHACRSASDPRSTRRSARLLGIGLGACFAYGAGGLYLLDAEMKASTTFAGAVGGAVELLLLRSAGSIEPATRHGAWFVESVRLGVLAVLAAALVTLLRPVLGGRRRPEDRQDVTRILEAQAATSLAPFHLLDDKLWAFSPDRQAFVGYALVGSTALALGEPIGAPGSRGAAAVAFLELCDANGWVPGFHQVTPEGLEVLGPLGLQALKIGEEAVVDVASFTTEGSGAKTLRSALRRVERGGLEVVELTQPIDEATMEQLRAVSDAWMADGGHRERTFTLGQFDPAYLRATTVLALQDGDGSIVAFANVIPSYQSTEGNFDLMRRRPDAPNGAMEALFVAMIRRFQGEGRRGMSLGLAPLSGITGDGLADRALKLLYERGGQLFNYAGLRAFKEKWHPAWEPRFLVYRTDRDLPRLAAAVTRAGELTRRRRWTEHIAGVARRSPFATVLFAGEALSMIATAARPGWHRWLLRWFGLSWPDLAGGEVWRVATSTLLQPRAGIVLGNLALLALVAVAERFLRTRRTALVFFLSDWVSSIAVLVGLRVASGLGSEPARRALAVRDGGTSSGTWALLAATCLLLPSRWRPWSLLAVAAFLAARLAVYGERADVEHVASIAVALAVSAWWARRPDTPSHGSDAATSTGESASDVPVGKESAS